MCPKKVPLFPAEECKESYFEKSAKTLQKFSEWYY